MDRPREPLPSRADGLPAIPPESRAALEEGLRLLGLADLPADARRAIEDHLRLLLAWNAAINLTAIRDPSVAVRRHVLDSLTAVAVLRRHAVDAFVDVGSGGGYPGLPLAVAVPVRRALLVDSIGKKARFLDALGAVVSPAGTVEAFAGRAEALAADRRHRERWPAVVARAVGSLAEVAELGLPLVARGGLVVAWKRGELGPELAAAASGDRGPRRTSADHRAGRPGTRPRTPRAGHRGQGPTDAGWVPPRSRGSPPRRPGRLIRADRPRPLRDPAKRRTTRPRPPNYRKL